MRENHAIDFDLCSLSGLPLVHDLRIEAFGDTMMAIGTLYVFFNALLTLGQAASNYRISDCEGVRGFSFRVTEGPRLFYQCLR